MNQLSPPVILQEVLEAKARGAESELASCIVKSQDHSVLDGTKTTCHLYHVKLDGNKRPMVIDLIRLAASSLVDYAIPRSRVAKAWEHYVKTNSAAEMSRLADEARGLFTNSPLTGEGGELLLFLLAEKVLRLPQLFSKMSLKTSTKHHFNGTDALHAGVSEAGTLALYWGEAKMHARWQSAVDEATEGLAIYLRNDNDKCRRDVQLLSEHIDLTDPALEEAICSYLLPSSPHYMQAEYRGIIFVGYNINSYSAAVDELTAEGLAEQVRNAYADWSQRVASRIATEKVEAIVLHVFLLPFPCVQTFRTEFLKAVGGANAP